MSVHEKILQWLEKSLYEGTLQLGQNLPDDRRIAAAIGSSNSSTREALKTLETMGIVRLYEGKRKTIITHLSSVPLASAGSALRLHMADSPHPLQDTVEMQILLESWAVSRAKPKEEVIAELDQLLDAMHQDGVLPQDFHILEVDFHLTLSRLADNRMVTAMLTTMRETLLASKLEMLGRVPLWSTFATRVRAEYQAILGAVKGGDYSTAARLVVANIEGQFEGNEIDLAALDEEALMARSLPDAEPEAVVFEPVEDEAEDSIPEEWNEAVSADLISALENIQPVLSDAPLAPSSQEEAPLAPVTQPSSQPEVQAEQEAEQVAASSEAEPAPLAPAPASTPASTPAQQGTEQASYEPALDKPFVPLAPAPAAPLAPSQEEDSTIIRASKPARRLRGTVSTPVHATVIRPRSSSFSAPGALGTQKVVRASDLATAKPASQPGEGESAVLRAPARPQAAAETTPERAAQAEEAGRGRKLLGRLFGLPEEGQDAAARPTSAPAEGTAEEAEAAPAKPALTKRLAEKIKTDKLAPALSKVRLGQSQQAKAEDPEAAETAQQTPAQTETAKSAPAPEAAPEEPVAPKKSRAELRAEAKKAAAERRAAAREEARRRQEEERLEIERLAAAQAANHPAPEEPTFELAEPEENPDSLTEDSLPEGYVVFDGELAEPVYEDDLPEEAPEEEDGHIPAASPAEEEAEEELAEAAEAPGQEAETLQDQAPDSKPQQGQLQGGNALNKGKKKKKKRR